MVLTKGYTHRLLEQSRQSRTRTHTNIASWFLAKLQKHIRRERIAFLVNGVGFAFKCKIMNLDLYFIPYITINFKCIIDLNVKYLWKKAYVKNFVT